MKTLLVFLLTFTFLFPACSQNRPTSADENLADSVRLYTEQARQGEEDGYIRLAELYRTGRGVDRSFTNMVSLYSLLPGRNGRKLYDRLRAEGPDDPFLILFESVELGDTAAMERNAERLDRSNPAFAKAIRALRLSFNPETSDRSLAMIREAGDEGCDFAYVLLAIGYDKSGQTDLYEAHLLQHAPKLPAFHALLGELYSGQMSPDSEKTDTLKAVDHYLQADSRGFLTPKGARFLIDYYEAATSAGKALCDEAELARLRKIARQ